MSDELLKRLKEEKEKKEKAYAEAKGMMEGARLTLTSQTDKTILQVLEFSINLWKQSKDRIDSIQEQNIYVLLGITNLQKEVRELRKTLDTFQENK